MLRGLNVVAKTGPFVFITAAWMVYETPEDMIPYNRQNLWFWVSSQKQGSMNCMKIFQTAYVLVDDFLHCIKELRGWNLNAMTRLQGCAIPLLKLSL